VIGDDGIAFGLDIRSGTSSLRRGASDRPARARKIGMEGSTMTTQPKKCAMEGCSCIPEAGKKYCSTYCENAKGMTTLKCNCGHAGCAGGNL
jgi:hypothetical protein